MGLIKAALGSVGSVLCRSVERVFYCDSMAANVLVTKGKSDLLPQQQHQRL